ncbi:MAG: HD-GYP domain-containing protein, partial [Candidatus Omnitrophica bacterium]|nr:HD-GYP domain-containing protein [Candidatus Omnitrophota bacterium]
IMSLIPVCVLFYLYLQIKSNGFIELSIENLNVTLIIVVIGVIVGYFAMRSIIMQIIRLTQSNKKMLESVLSSDKLKELGREKNEINVLSSSFGAINDRLEENVRNLERAKKTLYAVMIKIGEGVSNMQNIDAFLDLIIETVTDALSSRVGLLIFADDTNEKDNRDSLNNKNFYVKTAYGTSKQSGKPLHLDLIKCEAIKQALEKRKPVVISEIKQGFECFSKAGYELNAPLICAPLVIQEQIRGLIIVCNKKTSENYDEDEKNLLFNLASQTAVAAENVRLNKNIEATYFETISALALAVDAKDKYSRGHLDRVAEYCVQIGNKLGLDEDDLQSLRDAAKLHDLGKIGIPDDVLRKEGALSDSEWILMRKHPEIGESIIKPITSLSHLCDIIRHHHEKLDGTGYPDGLKRDQISPLVRILAISDVYDALTVDRSYRQKMTKTEAARVLRTMDNHLDQDIVEAFIESLYA